MKRKKQPVKSIPGSGQGSDAAEEVLLKKVPRAGTSGAQKQKFLSFAGDPVINAKVSRALKRLSFDCRTSENAKKTSIRRGLVNRVLDTSLVQIGEVKVARKLRRNSVTHNTDQEHLIRRRNPKQALKNKTALIRKINTTDTLGKRNSTRLRPSKTESSTLEADHSAVLRRKTKSVGYLKAAKQSSVSSFQYKNKGRPPKSAALQTTQIQGVSVEETDTNSLASKKNVIEKDDDEDDVIQFNYKEKDKTKKRGHRLNVFKRVRKNSSGNFRGMHMVADKMANNKSKGIGLPTNSKGNYRGMHMLKLRRTNICKGKGALINFKERGRPRRGFHRELLKSKISQESALRTASDSTAEVAVVKDQIFMTHKHKTYDKSPVAICEKNEIDGGKKMLAADGSSLRSRSRTRKNAKLGFISQKNDISSTAGETKVSEEHTEDNTLVFHKAAATTAKVTQNMMKAQSLKKAPKQLLVSVKSAKTSPFPSRSSSPGVTDLTLVNRSLMAPTIELARSSSLDDLPKKFAVSTSVSTKFCLLNKFYSKKTENLTTGQHPISSEVDAATVHDNGGKTSLKRKLEDHVQSSRDSKTKKSTEKITNTLKSNLRSAKQNAYERTMTGQSDGEFDVVGKKIDELRDSKGECSGTKETPRKRGRPKGSLNKLTIAKIEAGFANNLSSVRKKSERPFKHASAGPMKASEISADWMSSLKGSLKVERMEKNYKEEKKELLSAHQPADVENILIEERESEQIKPHVQLQTESELISKSLNDDSVRKTAFEPYAVFEQVTASEVELDPTDSRVALYRLLMKSHSIENRPLNRAVMRLLSEKFYSEKQISAEFFIKGRCHRDKQLTGCGRGGVSRKKYCDSLSLSELELHEELRRKKKHRKSRWSSGKSSLKKYSAKKKVQQIKPFVTKCESSHEHRVVPKISLYHQFEKEVDTSKYDQTDSDYVVVSASSSSAAISISALEQSHITSQYNQSDSDGTKVPTSSSSSVVCLSSSDNICEHAYAKQNEKEEPASDISIISQSQIKQNEKEEPASDISIISQSQIMSELSSSEVEFDIATEESDDASFSKTRVLESALTNCADVFDVKGQEISTDMKVIPVTGSATEIQMEKDNANAEQKENKDLPICDSVNDAAISWSEKKDSCGKSQCDDVFTNKKSATAASDEIKEIHFETEKSVKEICVPDEQNCSDCLDNSWYHDKDNKKPDSQIMICEDKSPTPATFKPSTEKSNLGNRVQDQAITFQPRFKCSEKSLFYFENSASPCVQDIPLTNRAERSETVNLQSDINVEEVKSTCAENKDTDTALSSLSLFETEEVGSLEANHSRFEDQDHARADKNGDFSKFIIGSEIKLGQDLIADAGASTGAGDLSETDKVVSVKVAEILPINGNEPEKLYEKEVQSEADILTPPDKQPEGKEESCEKPSGGDGQMQNNLVVIKEQAQVCESVSRDELSTFQNQRKKRKYHRRKELTFLQSDEGAQKILLEVSTMKRRSNAGKLLRSKTRDEEEISSAVDGEKPKKRRYKRKHYSVDSLSEMRFVIRSGSSTAASSRAVLTTSGSIDSEDGRPPPDITEIQSILSSHSDRRSQSRDLSPPPLIDPNGVYVVSECQGMVKGSDCTTHYRSSHPILHTSRENDSADHNEIGRKRRGRPRKRSRMGPASKTGRSPLSEYQHSSRTKEKCESPAYVGPASGQADPVLKELDQPPFLINSVPREVYPAFSLGQSSLQATEPRKFELRQKTSRSPIALLAMRQKMEDEDWNLQEATKLARALKRKQAHSHRLSATCDSECTPPQCHPCCVVLVDFVKKLHLNQGNPDEMEDYISDISYDSSEQDMTDEDDFYTNEDVDHYNSQQNYADSVKVEQDIVLKKMQSVTKSSARKSPVKSFVPFRKGKHTQEANEDDQEVEKMTSSSLASSSQEQLAEQKLSAELANIKSTDFISNFIDFLNNKNQENLLPAARGASRPSWSFTRLPMPPVTSATTKSPPLGTTSPKTCGVSVVGSKVYDASGAGNDSALSLSLQPSSPSAETRADGKSETSLDNAKELQSTSSGEDLAGKEQLVISSPTKLIIERAHTPGPAAVARTMADKGASPGKLKLFARRESQGGSGSDKVTPTTRYICTTCKYAAYSKGTIESHVYIHIPGVAFKCGYCNTEFASLVSIQAHVKNSHNSKEVKVWISKDISETNFYREEQIEKDVQSNDSASSVVSDSETSLKGELNVHRVERYNSSPLSTLRRFACTHCSYSTDVKEDAQQHVRDIHLDSSLYTCCLCNKILGCSRSEVLSHCHDTHPQAHRPSPYKKLPDFYDQEILQANSVSDRSKPTEDRGNIFDRMSSFLGPGVEMTEEGQLSPQARYVRAKDYLYIQEGWCKKTSAEADSTTNEDIEMPLEDTADSEGVDSTSDAVPQHGCDSETVLQLTGTNSTCQDDASGEESPRKGLETHDLQEEKMESRGFEAVRQTPSRDGSLFQQQQQLTQNDDEDEANGDILVINLDDDEGLMLDGSGSHPSTPEEEKSQPLLGADEEFSTANDGTQLQESTNRGKVDTDTASGVGQTVSEPEDSTMGIKIVEVISLQGRSAKSFQDAFTAKSTSFSSPNRSDSLAPTAAATEFTSGRDVPSESSSATINQPAVSGYLPEVNADTVAARNERKVCTYKCHVCNVHSPQLQPIVEHLKQYHDNVPLFSCPYCKNKKDTFFKENDVHLHVSEKHPSNYAKNEVSLSELAKSFVQVISFLPGRGIRSVKNIQDIWMCVLCHDHLPDLEFAFRHLKLVHPDVQFQYMCPTCTIFRNNFQDVIKTHSRTIHDVEITEPLVPVLEGIYFARVISVSVGGLYVDHKPKALSLSLSTTGLVRPSSTPLSMVASSGTTGNQQQTKGTSSVRGKQLKLKECAVSDMATSASAQPRLILPMPVYDAKKRPASETFHRTGVTVKHLLEASTSKLALSATGSSPSTTLLSESWSPQGLNVQAASAETPAKPLSPRAAEQTDMIACRVQPDSNLHISSSKSSWSSAQSSAHLPVLKVPNLSISHNLPAFSVEMGVPITAVVDSSTVLPAPKRPAASLPFSIAALTSPASSSTLGNAVTLTHHESDDPESYKMFNLKPKPASTSSTGQALLVPANVSTTTVTMASALFPQQFCVQQDIRTLPIGPGGLSLTNAVSLPIPSPFQVSVRPLGTVSMTDVPTLMKLQPGPLFFPTSLINIPGVLPLLPTAPAAHQHPPSTLPSFAVNLPIAQPGSASSTLAKMSGSQAHATAAVKLSTSEPVSCSSRGRGRPRLNRNNPFEFQSRPGPVRSTLSQSPVLPVPLATMQLPQPLPAHSGSSPTPSVRAQRHASQHCQCPYCLMILKPWEVAQHIQMKHPGQEIKYNRIN